MNNLGHARLDTLTKIMAFMPNSVASIQKETKLTYSHILRVVRVLEEKQLISIDKKGRCLVIKMTKEGQRLKDCLTEADRILKG